MGPTDVWRSITIPSNFVTDTSSTPHSGTISSICLGEARTTASGVSAIAPHPSKPLGIVPGMQNTRLEGGIALFDLFPGDSEGVVAVVCAKDKGSRFS